MAYVKIKAKDDYRKFKNGAEFYFDFEKNPELLMVGKNGSGKSTLVNALRGWKSNMKKDNKKGHSMLSLSGESFNEISKHFDIESDFEKIFYLSSEADDPTSIWNASSATGYIESGGYETMFLSTGQTMMVIFSKFFREIKDQLDDKSLVIMDECEKGIDVENQQVWVGIGKKLNEDFGCSVLKITHNVFEISLKNEIFTLPSGNLFDTKKYLQINLGYTIDKPKKCSIEDLLKEIKEEIKEHDAKGTDK